LGADVVIDYSIGDYERAVRDLVPGGVDAALDSFDATRAARTIRPGGRLAVLTGQMPRVDTEISVLPVTAAPSGEVLFRLRRMADQGDLRVQVEAVFPLSQVADAHRLVGSGHVRGKVILSVD
jgi:NADPH:quinone reductase-like Zn-dependent oxidoreductase